MNVNAKSNMGVAIVAVLSFVLAACNAARASKEVESHRYGDVVISLLNDKGDLKQGKNRFMIAFRSATSGQPMDAGQVQVSATMTMPGMSPMSAGIEIQPANATGRYLAEGNFGMSGNWRFDVRWDGPAGRGSALFNSSVR
jgi:hypothetical protein